MITSVTSDSEYWVIFLLSVVIKKSFRNNIRESNSLDPDQAQHFVGADLGPLFVKDINRFH